MAVYAATVTLDTPKPGRLGNSPMGVLSGTCSLSNYNSTLAEITAITGAFLPGGKLRVVPGGLTTQGYGVKWDSAGKAFRAYRTAAGVGTLTVASGTAATHPLGVSGAAGNLVSDTTYSGIGTVTTLSQSLNQAANDLDIGSFDFIAVGQLG